MTTIFIVDDEIFLHELYRDIFSINGIKIIGEAFDGEEALEKYRPLNPKPDIVIMDHRMPLKNGLEATREMLELDPSACIIFASADNHAAQTLKSHFENKSMGVKIFLQKPFTISSLMDAINETMKGSSSGIEIN
jgi:two-component system chemotaxis response regulator CheY